MAYATLFPYTQRALGLQEQLTAKDEAMSPSQWAGIFMANLKAGDQFSLAGHPLTVVKNDNEALVYLTQSQKRHTIAAAEIDISPLFSILQDVLPTLAPEYTDPLCHILERDPAVYRLRDRTGWVINDALCLMSGNITYGAKNPPAVQQPDVSLAAPGKEPVRSQEARENGKAETAQPFEKEENAAPALLNEENDAKPEAPPSSSVSNDQKESSNQLGFDF